MTPNAVKLKLAFKQTLIQLLLPTEFAGNDAESFSGCFEKLKALVITLYRAGVPIVAGTDGSGIEIIRELELYV